MTTTPDRDMACSVSGPPPHTEPILIFNDVQFSYTSDETGRIVIFSQLNMAVRPTEIVCVVGPSGCGKTTLLNLAAGLIAPTSGGAMLAGQPADGSSVPRAIVFQHPNLLPWRTVRRNVTYGLEMRRVGSRRQHRHRADELLSLVGLSDYADAYTWQLSGGMQQRVNLARALAVRPTLLLLDEPFAALDAQTRTEMQREFLSLCQTLSTTAVFVTHDIDEAVFLGDRVVVLGHRGSDVVDDLVIDLPRPRNEESKYTPPFAEFVRRVAAGIRTSKAPEPHN